MKTIVMAIATLAIALPAQAQVYRCINDSKTVFSDIPCPITADVAEEVRIFDDKPTDTDAARARDRHQTVRDDFAFEDRTRNAVRRSQIFVGMRAADARRSWGNPTSVNRSHYGSGVKEQWVYHHGPGKSQYVYVEGGRVTAIQE